MECRWRRLSGNPTYYYDANTLFAPDGTIQSGPLSKFLSVLSIAKSEGLLVDVTFTAETVAECFSGSCTIGNPDGAYLSRTNYQNAIASIAATLATGSTYKHVLFDLQNEYDQNGAGGASAFTNSQIRAIRNAVKGADIHRIVTASIAHDVSPGTAADWEIESTEANLDAIAWHEYQYQSFWLDVDNVILAMQAAQPDPPIYLQEPTRLRNDGSHDNTN